MNGENEFLQNLEISRQKAVDGYALRVEINQQALQRATDDHNTLNQILNGFLHEIDQVQTEVNNMWYDALPGTFYQRLQRNRDLESTLRTLKRDRDNTQRDMEHANRQIMRINREMEQQRVAYENRINFLDFERFRYIFENHENIML